MARLSTLLNNPFLELKVIDALKYEVGVVFL